MYRPGHDEDSSLGASLAIFGYSESARLGVSLALSLARVHPERLKIDELARLAESTYASTGRALRLLAAGHLARSTRGPRGGWRLTRPANTIRMLDVLGPFCVNGTASWARGDDEPGDPGSGDGHSLDWLVRKARAAAVSELAGVTLAELLEGSPKADEELLAGVEVDTVTLVDRE